MLDRSKCGALPTILILDDDSCMLELCARVLGNVPYRTLKAENGTQALNWCRTYEGSIDLLLLDVMLPPKELRLRKRSGVTALHGAAWVHGLLRMRPESRVLFMSAHSRSDLDDAGILLRDWPLLQKPFLPEALVAKVRDVLSIPPSSPQRQNG
jgi:DNA-binding response OmpR family regulator